jgi:hypothetical protein
MKCSLDEVAKSYLILRPLPENADVTTDTVNASKHDHDRLRIIHLPKKKLPKRPGTDRFMYVVWLKG